MTDEKTNETKQEEVQFPLNKRLLEESAKIKEERKVIKERLAKIDESKKDVSGDVYEKVKADYMNQLQNNTDQLLEKKQDIDRELASLNEAKNKVSENVNKHRHQLEELNFRNNLGEYKKGEFSKLSSEENEKLGKFEKILAAIESNIKEYESLFEGEEEIAEEYSDSVASEGTAPPPPHEDTEDKTPIHGEEKYDVGGDTDNYFSPDTDEIPVEEKNYADTTQKNIAADDSSKYATVKIVEGDGKGEVVELKTDDSTIGRASSNTVVLKEAKVSRQHASIKRHGKEYLITDLHSSNGVFVNNERIKEHALSDGDKIQIGDFILEFKA